MATVKRIWIVVCFLFIEFLTGSEGSRLRRQAPGDGQDPSLQDLSGLLGQLPSQTLTNGMDLSSLMNSFTQGSTGAGQTGGVDLSSFMNSLTQGSTGAGQTGGADLSSFMSSLTQGSTGAGQTGGVDLSSVLEMAEALQQQTPEAGGQSFPTQDGGTMQVYVETKTLDDLLASEGGRQQLGQLNAQLEQALDSLADSSVHVMQAQQGVDGMGVMLGDITRLLSGGLQGLADNQTTAMLAQLLQSVDQLPALKGAVESVYQMLAGLDSSLPSSLTHSLQQLVALAASSLQGSVTGRDSVRQMLDMALTALTDNLELINNMLADPAALLHAANDTRCLLTSLTSPQPDRGLALQCMTRLLLQSAPVTQHNSEQILDALNVFLNDFLDDPSSLQSVMALLQTPSLDGALAVVQSLVGQLDVAGLDLATAVQSVQGMLSSLTRNPQLLEAVAEVLQDAEGGQLYGQLVDMLHDASQASPLTQQLVVMVNDTLVTLWTSGDLTQALDTLRHVTAMLTSSQDPAQPWSPAQQAFLDLLHRLTDMILHLSSTTPTLPPTPTTPTPAVTTTTITTIAPTTTTDRKTTPMPERTTSPATATTTTTTAQPATSPAPATTSTPAPATTRRDTVDDEGDSSGTHVSCSVLSLLLALLLAGWLS